MVQTLCIPYRLCHFANVSHSLALVGQSSRLPMMGFRFGPGGSTPVALLLRRRPSTKNRAAVARHMSSITMAGSIIELGREDSVQKVTGRLQAIFSDYELTSIVTKSGVRPLRMDPTIESQNRTASCTYWIL